MEKLCVEVLLPFERSSANNVQIEMWTVDTGEKVELTGYPEERLYYVQEGHGTLSVYDEIGKGDMYIVRPDVALYFTPGLLHEIENTGSGSMKLIVFRVRGGVVPAGAMEGVQKWTSLGESTEVGCGFWYTDIFNLHENETAREGLDLQLWGIGTRRAQKLEFGELLTEAPGGSIRKHAHANSDEYYYVIQGQGTIYIGEETMKVNGGNTACVPANVVHHLTNTGNTPLMWIDINVRYEGKKAST